MSILNTIKEATKEADSFANHPVKELSLEERLLYLQGLALVMNADSEITQKEKEYLVILIKSFDLDETVLESCVDFALEPDRDTIQSFIKKFKRKAIVQLFVFDALMIANKDGGIKDSEKEVIDELVLHLELVKGVYTDVYDFFCYIVNRKWNETAVYFSMDSLNSKYYKHVLSYFDVEVSQLMLETKELTKDALMIDCKKIISSENFSNELLVPFLQAKLDRNEISYRNGWLTLPDNSTAEISSVSLGFDALSREFFISGPKDISDSPLYDFYVSCFDFNEVEMYSMLGDVSNIINTVVSEDKKNINLDSPLQEGSVLNINDSLWRYLSAGSDNALSHKTLYAKDKIDTSKSAIPVVKPAQKSAYGNIGFFGSISQSSSAFGSMSEEKSLGKLVRYFKGTGIKNRI